MPLVQVRVSFANTSFTKSIPIPFQIDLSNLKHPHCPVYLKGFSYGHDVIIANGNQVVIEPKNLEHEDNNNKVTILFNQGSYPSQLITNVHLGNVSREHFINGVFNFSNTISPTLVIVPQQIHMLLFIDSQYM